MSTLYPIGIHVQGGHVLDRFSTTTVLATTGGHSRFEPDYLCFLGYAWIVLKYVAGKHPEAEKVDFIVERKQRVTKYIQEFHSQLAVCLNALGSPSLAKLAGELIPAGKERIPLQAADVLCWHTCRPRGIMDSLDIRRYTKLARRGGTRTELTNDQISLMEETFWQP